MRAACVFLLLSVLLPVVFSFSVSTDKTSYLKGEELCITCSGTPGPVNIVISNGPRLITTAECLPVQPNDHCAVSYRTKALDPKGAWTITASKAEEKKSTSISVSPTREDAFYLVRFTSPPHEGAAYLRTETIQVSATVLDAGKPVSGATVRAFAGPKEFQLAETSPGVYARDYELPFDAAVGGTDIYLVAEKNSSGESFGGENSLKIEVKQVPIQVEFLTPGEGSYKLGETIPVQAKVSYSTGKSVESPSMSIKANELPLQILRNGDVYSAEYKTRQNDSGGVLTFLAEVSDSAGNSGSAFTNVEVKGIGEQAVTDYYWYLVLGGILLLVVAAFTVKTFLSRSSLEKLEKEREDLLAMEKGLQEDYIKKGTIDRETFQKRMAVYEAKLTDLEERIKRMKGAGKK